MQIYKYPVRSYTFPASMLIAVVCSDLAYAVVSRRDCFTIDFLGFWLFQSCPPFLRCSLGHRCRNSRCFHRGCAPHSLLNSVLCAVVGSSTFCEKRPL